MRDWIPIINMYDSIPSLPTKESLDPQGFPPFEVLNLWQGLSWIAQNHKKKHCFWTNTFCWDTNFEVPKKTHCSFWPNLLLPIILPNFGPEVFSLNLLFAAGKTQQFLLGAFHCHWGGGKGKHPVFFIRKNGNKQTSSFFNACFNCMIPNHYIKDVVSPNFL